MTINLKQMEKILSYPLRFAAEGELRREGDLFLLGAGLSPEQVLEQIFDSDAQSPVDLFLFSFPAAEDFLRTEELVRAVKKNFKGYLLGQFAATPPPSIIDRAYAAGIDLIDLPIPADGDGIGTEERLRVLDYAQEVFPRWSVLATLAAGAEPPAATAERIESLLKRGVLPILVATEQSSRLPASDLVPLFEQLKRAWSRARAIVRPLRALLLLATPLALPPKKGLGTLLERLDDARLRTASDLRRLLRVREVEQSFESAGL